MTTETLKERVSSLEYSIHGNGAKGMKEQIEEISKDVKEIKNTLIVLQRRQDRFVGIAIGVSFVLSISVGFILKLWT